MLYKTTHQTPLGKTTLCSDGLNLVGLWLENQKYFANTITEPMLENPALEVFQNTKSWLDKYFKGEKPEISSLPLLMRGSNFRKAVWELLKEIPYGEITTYKNIAEQIAKQNGIQKMSAQAIGGAVGHNPISIIIPCHRVIGSNGSLTGYAGGLHNKIKLLEHEGIDLARDKQW